MVLDDSTEANLTEPNGNQNGIKLPLPALEINEDVVEITIDFDVSKSFVKRGNSGKGYIFKPVLKPIALSINGEDIDLDDGES